MKVNALGQYLINELKQNFNFKEIKKDSVYRDVLFTFRSEDYIICDNLEELEKIITLMKYRATSGDYPLKLLKRYTHRKFEKIHKKQVETMVVKQKKYYIIKL